MSNIIFSALFSLSFFATPESFKSAEKMLSSPEIIVMQCGTDPDGHYSCQITFDDGADDGCTFIDHEDVGFNEINCGM